MHSYFFYYIVTFLFQCVRVCVHVCAPFVFFSFSKSMCCCCDKFNCICQIERKKSIYVSRAHSDSIIAIIISLERQSLARQFVGSHFIVLSLDFVQMPPMNGDWWFSALLQFFRIVITIFPNSQCYFHEQDERWKRKNTVLVSFCVLFVQNVFIDVSRCECTAQKSVFDSYRWNFIYVFDLDCLHVE